MSVYLVGPGAGGTDDLDPSEGWGEVPEVDRPVWARYMLDHCPWFPGPTIMTLIAGGVVNGGAGAPQVWKETATELHSAGFTPIHYFLLAELLSDARKRGDLDEATHGHLFKQWFKEPFPAFRLDAEAWKPWLERLERAESPRRALEHMLHGPNLPPLGTVRCLGESPLVVAD